MRVVSTATRRRARFVHLIFDLRDLIYLRCACSAVSYKERHSTCLCNAKPTSYSGKVHNASHTLVHALRHRHVTAGRERAAALTHDLLHAASLCDACAECVRAVVCA